jgi:hypothetical protein
MFKFFGNIRTYFGKLLDKKRYLEFLTALLSVPVLITVLFLNYSNIQDRKKTTLDTQIQPIITIVQQGTSEKKEPSPTETAECLPEIGGITIDTPQEGASISSNPLAINIERVQDGEKYCSIVWSYRINSGNWSDFSDKDISIFNMESGEKTLELKIKSIVSGEEKNITRKFTYKNTQEVPTPTPSATATPSPSPTIEITQPVQ